MPTRFTTSDIMAILRRFDVATDDNYNRQIDQIKKSSPTDKSTLVSFRFQKTQFYILFDYEAEDNETYVLRAIQTMSPNAQGNLIQNPISELYTYGLPFKGKEVYLFQHDPQRIRLDLELAERYPDTSRATWQKYIKEGYVNVNGKTIVKPRTEIGPTDDIAVSVPAPTDFSDQELPIIYVDDSVIVINKPVGMLTHSKGALNDEFTVATFFARYTKWGLETNRPGIVHRLDRDTSGVMIGARTEEAAELLQKQFAQRTTHKTYFAVVKGVPKNLKAIIDLPIDRNPSSPSTFRVDVNGKSAVTAYEVLATNGTESLIKLQPKTGRTHQLRVHLAYLNTPIIGDRVYGKAADRLYLHAEQLEITVPQSDRKTFVAPLPPEFTQKFPDYRGEGV